MAGIHRVPSRFYRDCQGIYHRQFAVRHAPAGSPHGGEFVAGDKSPGSGATGHTAPSTASGGTVQRVADVPAAKALLQSHYGTWQKGLSAKADAAMAFYQSPGYELMNGQLRGSVPTAPAKDLARAADATKHLKAAIASAPPLTKALEVHRGFNLDQFGDLKAGQTVTEKGFTSTSLIREGAGQFNTRGRSALATITLPAGTKAAAGSIKELVLPPGTSFKVTGIKKQGKVTHVTMEVVG